MVTTRFTETFGCRHPLQQAGIGGVATPDLAIAVARAGGLGMLTGTVGHEVLSVQLDVLPPDASIGVNFLVPFLDRVALDDASNRSPFSRTTRVSEGEPPKRRAPVWRSIADRRGRGLAV